MAKRKKLMEINGKEELKSKFKMNILFADNNNVANDFKHYDMAIVKMKTTGETIEEFDLKEVDNFEKEIKKTVMENKLIVYDYVTEGDNVVFNCITLEEFYLANYFGDGEIEYIKDEDFVEEVEKFEEIIKEIKDESSKEVSESLKEVDNSERRSTIILSEKLAKECNYKSLRGLKMAISRKCGKGTYNTKTGEIDVVKLITVIAKRADTKTIEKLICSVDRENENVEVIDNNTIVFNVQKEIAKDIKTNIKVGALASAFARREVSDQELVEESIRKSKEKFIEKQDKLGKNIKEFTDVRDKLADINNILAREGSNLRFKQFVRIDKDLYITQNLYLTGNGYFKRLFDDDINCIVIKNQYGEDIYFDWCETEEEKQNYINELEENKLYIFDPYGDGNDIEIDLKDNFDDGIDYDKTEMEIILQMLDKKRLITSINSVDWLNFNTEDEKIDFDLRNNDVFNILLLLQGQERFYTYDYRYQFSLEDAKKILKQMRDKKYKQIVNNVEYEIQ